MTNALPELDPSSTARLLMDFQHATLLAFFFIGRASVTPTPASAIVDLGGGISKSLDDNLYRSEPGSRPTSVGFRCSPICCQTHVRCSIQSLTQ
jgi:hypothetical protein